MLVEPIGTRRTDNINVFDMKAEKTIPLAGRLQVRGFVDFFNILNSNAAETISYATGPSFENPTNIIAPRAMRIGFRLEW